MCPHGSLRENIEQVAIQTYEELAQEHGVASQDIPRMRLCVHIARKMRERLTALDFPMQIGIHNTLRWIDHAFLLHGRTIIDGAWKQFHPSPTVGLPNVLICEINALKDTLNALGVPEADHCYWLSPRIIENI